MTSRSLTFGRGPGADVTYADDKYMSPVHCRIEQRGSHFWVEDLGSTNGTYIIRPGFPDIRVPWIGSGLQLLPGDQVRIGRTTLPWEAQ